MNCSCDMTEAISQRGERLVLVEKCDRAGHKCFISAATFHSLFPTFNFFMLTYWRKISTLLKNTIRIRLWILNIFQFEREKCHCNYIPLLELCYIVILCYIMYYTIEICSCWFYKVWICLFYRSVLYPVFLKEFPLSFALARQRERSRDGRRK